MMFCASLCVMLIVSVLTWVGVVSVVGLAVGDGVTRAITLVVIRVLEAVCELRTVVQSVHADVAFPALRIDGIARRLVVIHV